MSAISGFVDFGRNYLSEGWGTVARDMLAALRHRGPDGNGIWQGKHALLCQAGLTVLDAKGDAKPLRAKVNDKEYVVVLDGRLQNAQALRDALHVMGYTFSTMSDAEVILFSYIEYGQQCLDRLVGVFAFVVYDEARSCVFAARDRMGVKPLFYAIVEGAFVFASEIKGLFEYPGFAPSLSREGLLEVLAIGPARTAGCAIFEGVSEVLPAHLMIINRDGVHQASYWRLHAADHEDSYEQTIQTVHDMVQDTIIHSLDAAVPLCSLLSGGLDSSLITSVVSKIYKEKGEKLSTYSFEFVGNKEHFSPTAFQPDSDADWTQRVSSELGTDHQVLVCGVEELGGVLDKAMRHRDLPGMADIDASLLYFCSKIKKNHTVVLSGECADEIFGGYPWFHSEEALHLGAFPWSPDLSVRQSVFDASLVRELRLHDHMALRYQQAIAGTPRLEGESIQDMRRREMAYINLTSFMPALIDRKDRMTAACSLEARVPYCDPALIQYVFNIPWEMKSRDGARKHVLREAARGLLSEDVRLRPKSPFPKTHNPMYEQLIKQRVVDLLHDKNAPIQPIIDVAGVETWLKTPSQKGKPWFGQLMAGVQLGAYLLQINSWMKDYGLSV